MCATKALQVSEHSIRAQVEETPSAKIHDLPETEEKKFDYTVNPKLQRIFY
jgi:hypothetical protein